MRQQEGEGAAPAAHARGAPAAVHKRVRLLRRVKLRGDTLDYDWSCECCMRLSVDGSAAVLSVAETDMRLLRTRDASVNWGDSSMQMPSTCAGADLQHPAHVWDVQPPGGHVRRQQAACGTQTAADGAQQPASPDATPHRHTRRGHHAAAISVSCSPACCLRHPRMWA